MITVYIALGVLVGFILVKESTGDSALIAYDTRAYDSRLVFQ